MKIPEFIKQYMNNRHITDDVLSLFEVSYEDEKIVFPVKDIDNKFLFKKYRRSPVNTIGPKYTYDLGGKVTLYGMNKAKDFNNILIVEGECDCLVAWSHNIPSATSTGGAQSFQKEWVNYFSEQHGSTCAKDVIICYDNDDAGAQGMVKTLEIIPWAKVLFIPDMPNVKDISDYVNAGGDLHELLKTARHFKDIAEVTEDRLARLATFRTVRFHDAYIKAHTKVNTYVGTRKTFSSDKVTNAKAYPLPNLLQFDKHGKTTCKWHKQDDTPSLQYYPKTNTAYCFACAKVVDSIEAYKTVHSCSFTEAVKRLNELK